MSSTEHPAHSCRHCRRIVLRREHFMSDDRQFPVPHTPAEIREALKDNCKFFMYFFLDDGFGDRKHLTRRSTLIKVVSERKGFRSELGKRILSRNIRLCVGTFSFSISTDSYDPKDHGDREERRLAHIKFYYDGVAAGEQLLGVQIRPLAGIAAEELSGSIDICPSPYVSSETSFCKTREWLSTCHASHPLCAQPPDDFLPTRLLKLVRVGEECTAVRLMDTIAENHVKWASLSYTWGGEQAFKSTLSLLDELRSGCSIDRLPRTLRDAIKVCENVGLDYIWIDSLCIVQDDKADLERGLATMPKIYQLAWVTISASSASTVSDGFLNDRAIDSKHDLAVSLLYASLDGSKVGSVILATSRANVWGQGYGESSPIHRRGWTFQERRLSPRLLDFNDHSLVFFCRTGKCCESGDLVTWSHLSKSDWKQYEHDIPCTVNQQLPAWRSIIEAYAYRELTYPRDKLTAIGALADLYRVQTQQTYIAGLWKESLVDDLCWINSSLRCNLLPRPSCYRAPSWSWAAVDLAKVVSHRLFKSEGGWADNRRTVFYAKVKNVSLHQEPPNTTYGRIHAGHLIIESLAFDTTCNYDGVLHLNTIPDEYVQIDLDAFEPELMAFGKEIPTLLLVIKVTTAPPVIGADGETAADGHCGTFGLILVAASETEYRRIGTFYIDNHGPTRQSGPYGPLDSSGAEFERRTVTII